MLGLAIIIYIHLLHVKLGSGRLLASTLFLKAVEAPLHNRP